MAIPSGLEDPEEQFRLLFSEMPHGAVYLDESLEILACNRIAEEIFGLSSLEAAGRSAYDPRWRTIHEDGSPFPPAVHPATIAKREGRPVLGEVMGVWNPSQERYRWARFDALPQFAKGAAGGAPRRILVWVIDVTDRVEAERSEAHSRDLFRSLFDSMYEGVAIHELLLDQGGEFLDYRIIDVNANYERHVGISRAAAVGRLGSEVYGVSPAPYLEEFGSTARSGKPYHFETYFPPLDKSFIISVAPLGPRGFATIFFDVSDIKRTEAERERLVAELERKNEELESIVYVSSHDLRSPLVNIQGFGSRLEKDCAELVSILRAMAEAGGTGLSLAEQERIAEIVKERIPRSLEFIRSSGKKMDRLIAGLLRLSRTGRAELRPQTLDMGRILGEIASAMAYQIEKTGAVLELGELPPCQGDAEQISQVFTNLIDNAIKYRSGERPARIAVMGERKGLMVEYRVEDNGIGIAPEHADKVWELFYRLDPQDSAGGEGLGLSLVRRIVERHKGRIRVESSPGAGSSFILQLPAALEAEVPR